MEEEPMAACDELKTNDGGSTYGMRGGQGGGGGGTHTYHTHIHVPDFFLLLADLGNALPTCTMTQKVRISSSKACHNTNSTSISTRELN